jgi:cellulose synthase/poly-beta-1,6-N-acetylglucosamine synthase-like glycosyltransferase
LSLLQTKHKRDLIFMISVAIPAYNSEKTIGQCLKALAEQSYPADSYEVIVVDDGSTDSTPAIAQSFATRYIRQENQGPAAARNNAARQAKGDIILFTDSDCVPDANWIREMVKPFEDSRVMAVKGAYRTQQNSLTARFAQVEFEERFEMLKKAETVDMVDTYSAGFRRKVFLDLGGFDPSFPVANNEDTEFSYRMSALNYRMVFNPQAIVYHLNHPDSIKKYARLKFWRGYWRMVVYRRFPNKMVKDTYTPQTLKLQILFLYLSLIMCLLTVLCSTSSLQFWPYFKFPLFFSIIAFGLSTLPFTIFAIRRDPAVGVLSGFFLIIRAASLGAGIIWAPLGLMGKNFLHTEKNPLFTRPSRKAVKESNSD